MEKKRQEKWTETLVNVGLTLASMDIHADMIRDHAQGNLADKVSGTDMTNISMELMEECFIEGVKDYFIKVKAAYKKV